MSKILCIIMSFILFGQPLFALRVGIVSSAHYCGEREVGWRIKKAAEKLGWNVLLDETKGRRIDQIGGLDFAIHLIPYIKPIRQCTHNFLTVFHPFNYITDQGSLVSSYKRFNGFLLAIEPAEMFLNSLHRLYWIPFYPTVDARPFDKLPLRNLATMLPVWGNRLTDPKFKNFYSILCAGAFTKFYGLTDGDGMVATHYMGPIPFDGESVLDVLQENGIVLILHSDIHNQNGIPTSRIFEAAAASAVIISDCNPFVQNNFGDSVYYIDTDLSAEEIYAQVENHMKSIWANPEQAWSRAEKAHQIFSDRFQMTDQLLKLEAMHKQLKINRMKKRKGLYDSETVADDALPLALPVWHQLCSFYGA